MTDAHAREVAAIEEMTADYCGTEPVRYGRSPAQDALFDLRKFQEALLRFRSLGTAVVVDHWVTVDTWGLLVQSPLPRAPSPQRVMGRPRKVAPKPGRKFSGMTRFSWRQR